MPLTFFTSIPAALILYEPVLNDADYVLGAGDDSRVTLGALLEICAISLLSLVTLVKGFRPSPVLAAP